MRTVVKGLASLIAWLLAAPIAYPLRWIEPLDARHQWFQMGSQLMSLLPGPPGVYLRRAFYRIVLRLSSTGFVVEFGTIFAQRGTHVGNDVYIGPQCNIGLSTIEDDVLIGSHVDIVSGKNVHFFDRLDVPIREQGGELRQVRIGRGSWIGNHAVVLADLGEGCVAGAGAVVIHDTPDLSITVGNPARVVKSREDAAPQRDEVH